jgi:hypothetical protein
MKIKRSIFNTGSDGKNGSGEAQSKGTGQPVAAHVLRENDIQSTVR